MKFFVYTKKQLMLRELERELLDAKMQLHRLRSYNLFFYGNDKSKKKQMLKDCKCYIKNIRKQIQRLDK